MRVLPAICVAAAAWASAAWGAVAPAAPNWAGRSECVRFRWDPGPNGPHAAISLPVSLNGRRFWFQLDTGTNVDILYGDVADRAGWTTPGKRSFRSSDLRIGSQVVAGARVSVWRDQPVAETSGEVGLADLAGRIAVLDYPRQRFCLFSADNIPDGLTDHVVWVEGDLRYGKFFLPVQTPGFASSAVVFDTGTSEAPLWVDLDRWTAITGLQAPDRAPFRLSGTSFTQPIEFKGALSRGPMTVGALTLGRSVVYTQTGHADAFRRWPYPVDGIIGNAPFEHAVVILDLAQGRTRMGVLPSPEPPSGAGG